MNYISQGYARIADHKRLILVHYLWNLLFSLFCLLPLYLLYKDFFGDSMIGEMEGGLETVIALADITHNRQGGFAVVLLFPLIGLGLNLIVSMALAGGSLAVLKQGQGYCPRTFWGGAGTWFLPFLRQWLWSLPLLALIGGAFALVGVAGEQIWGEAMVGSTAYFLRLTKIGIVVIGLFLYLRVLEYGRNLMMLNDLRSGRLAFWRGLKMAWKHAGKVLAIALGFVLPGLVILIAHFYLRISIEEPITLFAVTQIALLSRYALRVGLYAAQLDYATNLQPPVPADPEPEASPIEDTEAPAPKELFETEADALAKPPTTDDQSIDLNELEAEDPQIRL